jgi:hypothetical protein
MPAWADVRFWLQTEMPGAPAQSPFRGPKRTTIGQMGSSGHGLPKVPQTITTRKIAGAAGQARIQPSVGTTITWIIEIAAG